MKNYWSAKEAKKHRNNPLRMRVYSSRLIGQEPNLVLHGGGNTSVKACIKNRFGESEEILYVKGSGADLAMIESKGFSPVRLSALKKMAKLEYLSDDEMVSLQRSNMTDPNAPNPSVEAILHAIIPFDYVDHTHADAVVTLTNTPHGKKIIQDLYGGRIFIVPYIMPGFILAKKVYELTKNIHWENYEGMILLNHGVFTWGKIAKISYDAMIQIVSKAESYLKKNCRSGVLKNNRKISQNNLKESDCIELAKMRKMVSILKGSPMMALLSTDDLSRAFSKHPKLKSIACRGPLTPDHVIRTKPIPVILGKNPKKDIQNFSQSYKKYFQKHANGHQACLDTAPRWAVWQGKGIISFGESYRGASVVSDIVEHTIPAILLAESLGGWRALPVKDIFDMEYWVLEQMKLRKKGENLQFRGKIALVTGAANGIGRATAEVFLREGAVVVGLDIHKKIKDMFPGKSFYGLVCDLTKKPQVKKSVQSLVRRFGGLDILVSNAGIFPESESLSELKDSTWNKSLDVNLSSHQTLLQACIPYLSYGLEASVVFIASKNVSAPGPGVAAYSVAKAGLTQLGRIAALELAEKGIRVNVVHPNAVFDTGIWTKDVLKKRAKHYKMSVKEYKTNNLLKTEVTSKDVAKIVCLMCSGAFSKTTGAQIPIDGGNERVI